MKFLLYLLLWFIHSTCFADESILPILSLPDLSHWEENSFVGKTQYSIVHMDGQSALKAYSNKSASGLVREISVNLNNTPFLNWSWRIENTLTSVDEKTKAGDDYPARIYVVISGGLWFWKTRALNYVWASSQPLNTAWPNAFTDNATLLAVRSGEHKTGQWVSEKRNVLQDIKKYLQIESSTIDAIAIMTDTDNSGQEATAYYRDIYFSRN